MGSGFDLHLLITCALTYHTAAAYNRVDKRLTLQLNQVANKNLPGNYFKVKGITYIFFIAFFHKK